MSKRVAKFTMANGVPIFIDPDRMAIVEPMRADGETGTLIRVDAGTLVDVEVTEPYSTVVAHWQNAPDTVKR